jgi:arylsulfatase A-like enzyme
MAELDELRRRIPQNLLAVLPLGAALGFWAALAENYRVVSASPKLLDSIKDLTLVLTYGFLTTLSVVLVLTAVISILISLADIKGRVTPAKHSGKVIAVMVFLLALSSRATIIFAGQAASWINPTGLHYLDPTFAFSLYRLALIAWVVGFLAGVFVGRIYDPQKWPRILGNHYAITAGVATFIFGVYLAIYRSQAGEIYRSRFTVPVLEGTLYFLIFIVIGIVIFWLLRILFVRLSNRNPSYGIVLIVLFIIIPIVAFLRPAPPNDPDKHNPNPGNNGRNILLVSIDTLRYDRLGCNFNDYIKTPNIDMLAEESIIFDNCIVNMPITLPSHCSMLTGLNPRNHRVRTQDFYLDRSFLTIAERLSDEGFTCGGFVSMAIMGAVNTNLDQGFHYYDDYWIYANNSRFFPPEVKYFIAGLIINKVFTGKAGARSIYERRAEQAVDSALNWLDFVKDEDFFCFFHVFDPHWDNKAPEPYTDIYSPEYSGEFKFSPEAKDHIWTHKLKITEDDFNQFVARYDGEVTYMDAQLGRLFARLKELGLWDKTMIILTSDHGESFEHDYFFSHADRVYQSCIRVPLMIKPFYGVERQRYNVLCSVTDIFPTICKPLNISTPANLDGGSLFTYLNANVDEKAEIRPHIFSESYAFANYNAQHYGKTYSIIKDNDKLIYSPYGFPYVPIYQLYNLEEDTWEENNIYEPSSPLAEELAKLLEKWVADDEKTIQGMTGAIQRENLRSLQYLSY